MAVSVVEAARLMWCPGLSQLTGNAKGSIHDWFGTANFAPASGTKSLELQGIDRLRFLQALGADINRTATAASETLLNIIEIERLPKSLAWPYVKLYYAAFFYAHALLRIWGQSPSYFRTLELMPLRQLLNTYNVTSPFKVQTGQFILTAAANASVVEMTVESSGGGSHEAVWRSFNRALAELRSAIAGAPYLTADKSNLDTELKGIISLISKNGSNPSWLSFMRNEIQYRQSEGVWYQYKSAAKTAALQQEIQAVLNGEIELTKLIATAGADLLMFRSACITTIYFVRGVLADMSAIGGPKCFLRYGQRKFEDAVAAGV